jgi:hypothetical protein
MAPSGKVGKAKIDKRFASMLKDPSFGVSANVDRFGRKAKKQQEKELE